MLESELMAEIKYRVIGWDVDGLGASLEKVVPGLGFLFVDGQSPVPESGLFRTRSQAKDALKNRRRQVDVFTNSKRVRVLDVEEVAV